MYSKSCNINVNKVIKNKFLEEWEYKKIHVLKTAFTIDLIQLYVEQGPHRY